VGNGVSDQSGSTPDFSDSADQASGASFRSDLICGLCETRGEDPGIPKRRRIRGVVRGCSRGYIRPSLFASLGVHSRLNRFKRIPDQGIKSVCSRVDPWLCHRGVVSAPSSIRRILNRKAAKTGETDDASDLSFSSESSEKSQVKIRADRAAAPTSYQHPLFVSLRVYSWFAHRNSRLRVYPRPSVVVPPRSLSAAHHDADYSPSLNPYGGVGSGFREYHRRLLRPKIDLNGNTRGRLAPPRGP